MDANRVAIVVVIFCTQVCDAGRLGGVRNRVRSEAKPEKTQKAKQETKSTPIPAAKPAAKSTPKPAARKSPSTSSPKRPLVSAAKPRRPSPASTTPIAQALTTRTKKKKTSTLGSISSAARSSKQKQNERASNRRKETQRLASAKRQTSRSSNQATALRHAQIRNQVGRHRSHSHGAKRPRPIRAHQRRSPHSFGLHFSNFPPEPCAIVTEHHYYDPPVVIAAQATDVVPPSPMPSPAAAIVVPETETQPIPNCPSNIHAAVAKPVQKMQFVEPWHVRFAIQYASDSEELSQFGFDFLANETHGFGIHAGVNLHREKGFDYRDHLWLGDVNIVYELFASPHVRARAGLGVNWLADSYGAEAGVNMTLSADVELISNVFVAGEIDYGTLGDADFFHGRATLGVQTMGKFEYFAGYDYVNIGGAKIDGVVAGLRVRF